MSETKKGVREQVHAVLSEFFKESLNLCTLADAIVNTLENRGLLRDPDASPKTDAELALLEWAIPLLRCKTTRYTEVAGDSWNEGVRLADAIRAERKPKDEGPWRITTGRNRWYVEHRIDGCVGLDTEAQAIAVRDALNALEGGK